MSSSKVITLLLIGVTTGILIAPAKGSKSRKRLSKLVNGVADSIQGIIDVFCEETSDMAGKELTT